jgi:hypothetical protein
MAMDPAVELAICRTMAEEMEPYLLSNQLFRQLVVRTRSWSTIGGCVGVRRPFHPPNAPSWTALARYGRP